MENVVRVGDANVGAEDEGGAFLELEVDGGTQVCHRVQRRILDARYRCFILAM